MGRWISMGFLNSCGNRRAGRNFIWVRMANFLYGLYIFLVRNHEERPEETGWKVKMYKKGKNYVKNMEKMYLQSRHLLL